MIHGFEIQCAVGQPDGHPGLPQLPVIGDAPHDGKYKACKIKLLKMQLKEIDVFTCFGSNGPTEDASGSRDASFDVCDYANVVLARIDIGRRREGGDRISVLDRLFPVSNQIEPIAGPVLDLNADRHRVTSSLVTQCVPSDSGRIPGR